MNHFNPIIALKWKSSKGLLTKVKLTMPNIFSTYLNFNALVCLFFSASHWITTSVSLSVHCRLKATRAGKLSVAGMSECVTLGD